MKKLNYQVELNWTGNTGEGTSGYQSYLRDFALNGNEKMLSIPGSSDPDFLGDATRYNPEEMLLSSLSSCHMLWYLHLCAVNHVIVTAYSDQPEGTMMMDNTGSGRFEQVILKPSVTVKDKRMKEKALALHEDANKMCFIANSCNFPIHHQAAIEAENS